MDNPFEDIGNTIGDAVYDAVNPAQPLPTTAPAHFAPAPRRTAWTTTEKVVVGSSLAFAVFGLIYAASSES